MFYYRVLRAMARTLCLASFTLTTQAGLLPGDLLITEVMANPASVSDANGEWFEIFNTTDHAIDLTGLTIRDQGSNRFTVTGNTPITIAAGDYFVFGKNGDYTTNGGYQPDYVYQRFTLGNSRDAIILEDLHGVIDQLFYSGAPFGIAGHSAEYSKAGFQLSPATLYYGNGDIGSPGEGSQATTPPLAVTEPAPWMLLPSLAALLVAHRRSAARSD